MRMFHNVTEADRRLWKAPLVSQLFPFLWAEPHHADVSLSCNTGRGGTAFPKVALGSLRGSLASCWKGHGVQFPWLAVLQTYLSALFSFQRAVGLSACETYQLLIGFHRLTNFNTRTGKRENVKSCP